MSRVDDRRLVEVQIGRPLRADATVVSRCHLDLPVVVSVPPVLDDGTPFPTLYWLSCPLARTRIGRLESAGGVKRMDAKAAGDAQFGAALTAAHDAYREERERLATPAEGPLPSGGVGGSSGGVKCLHAHYAHTRAGRENPVGRLVASWIEPLDCERPCVVDDRLNPEWVGRP